MKKTVLWFIALYQIMISPFIHQVLGIKTGCRYPLSCSHYAAQTIKRFGVLKGGYLSIRRLLSCQQFFKTYVSV